ncbi:hypothetical protein LSAT2_028316 [Lamellibrachia satsuma]|nr:hypothetical protein LSAT2_028316 [Lamellibrachia satsuma]
MQCSGIFRTYESPCLAELQALARRSMTAAKHRDRGSLEHCRNPGVVDALLSNTHSLARSCRVLGARRSRAS